MPIFGTIIFTKAPKMPFPKIAMQLPMPYTHQMETEKQGVSDLPEEISIIFDISTQNNSQK